VARSLKKGQPVIVTGRFYSREYTTKDETSRVSYEVDAAAIGHDLSRGISEFTKVVRPVATTTVDVGPDGMPEDLTAQRFDPIPGPEAMLAAVG
jgi:single-strand DNA-binding protein